MIKNRKPITLAEARELLEKAETDKAKEIAIFIKRFTKLKAAEAQKLKKKLQALDIIKLQEEDIVKLIDFIPKDAEDVRKILVGMEVSLDQNEITKLLEVLKKK